MFDYSSIDLRTVGFNSGIMAAGISIASEVVQIRWTHPTQRLVIPMVRLSAAVLTGSTTGFSRFILTKYNSWTVDGSGGSTITLTGDQSKLDSIINGQALPTIRHSSTAALTAGTKTEAGLLSEVAHRAEAGNAFVLLPDSKLFSDLDVVARPIILNANEGLTIRVEVPGTNTWAFAGQIVYGVV